VIQNAQDSLSGDLVRGGPLAVAAWAGEKTDQADEPACENRPAHPRVDIHVRAIAFVEHDPEELS